MKTSLNPIVVIPARLAATRFPNKPLADIHGKPMIVHVWQRAVEANIGPVLVAAGDQAIADAVAAARAARRVAFESGEHGDRMPGDGGDGGNGDAALSFGNRPTRAIRPFELVSPWPPSSEQAAVVKSQILPRRRLESPRFERRDRHG